MAGDFGSGLEGNTVDWKLSSNLLKRFSRHTRFLAFSPGFDSKPFDLSGNGHFMAGDFGSGLEGNTVDSLHQCFGPSEPLQ